MSGEGWRDTQTGRGGLEGGLRERPRNSLFCFLYYFSSNTCNIPFSCLYFLFVSYWLFGIYLKIEQAHSGFHKGDQSNGFRQWPSFQAVLKPVNKLNTQGGLGGEIS